MKSTTAFLPILIGGEHHGEPVGLSDAGTAPLVSDAIAEVQGALFDLAVERLESTGRAHLVESRTVGV